MFGLGTTEIIVILVIALLLFGRRLPEVGKNLGRGIIEFKKGLKNVEDEVEQASNRPSTYQQTQALPRNEGTVGQLPAANAGGTVITGQPQDQRVSRADQVQ